MRYLTLALIAVALFALGSCTDEQIGRAQHIVDETDIRLAQANHAVDLAEQAVAQARDLAEKFQSAGALKAVDQATAALEQIKSVQAIAKTTSDATHAALDSAVEAQKAGGSTLAVLFAAGKGAVPMALLAIGAAFKWWQTLKSYRQTVNGLDDAKAALAANPATATAWDDHIAPALDAAHDASTRKLVAKIQASAA